MSVNGVNKRTRISDQTSIIYVFASEKDFEAQEVISVDIYNKIEVSKDVNDPGTIEKHLKIDDVRIEGNVGRNYQPTNSFEGRTALANTVRTTKEAIESKENQKINRICKYEEQNSVRLKRLLFRVTYNMGGVLGLCRS